MKRLLLVLGFVALFTLAQAQKTPTTTYNFQFLTTNGDPYCDGMFLKNYGSPQALVDGFHFDVICNVELGGGPANLPVNGFVTTVASNYQYGGGSGPVMLVGDIFNGLLCADHETLPPPYRPTSNYTCPQTNPNSVFIASSLYLINPTTNTWTLWTSGGGRRISGQLRDL